jgi:hypothetical protein
MTMKIYAYGIALAFAFTAVLINACLLHSNASRPVPVVIYHN